MIEDTGRVLRIYINHHKTEEDARHPEELLKDQNK
jgi:hypothetical protein